MKSRKTKTRETKIRRTITLTPAIAKKAEAMAKAENRTFSNFIENLLVNTFKD
jgi:hypothetical protein